MNKNKIVLAVCTAILLGVGSIYLFAPHELQSQLSSKAKSLVHIYCDTFTESARQIAIDAVREEIPEWPKDGLCGMVGKPEVAEIKS